MQSSQTDFINVQNKSLKERYFELLEHYNRLKNLAKNVCDGADEENNYAIQRAINMLSIYINDLSI